jgi:hypothetical protein
VAHIEPNQEKNGAQLSRLRDPPNFQDKYESLFIFRTVIDKKKTSCEEALIQLYAIYKVSA